MDVKVNHNKGFISHERLSKGPWQAFERAIARLLIHIGWEVSEVVGGSGDKGADIIAIYKDDSGNRAEYVYQAKYSENNKLLSVDIIGDLANAMDFYEIENGVAVSNRLLGEGQTQRLNTLLSNGYRIDTFLSKSIFESYNKLDDWPLESRSLKSYQASALKELQNRFNNGGKSGLVCLATGLGKTFVAASFLRWVFENNSSMNVLILAHTKSLIEQFDRSIWNNLPKWISTHLVYDSEKPSYNEGVILSTFQSIEKFLQNSSVHFDLVIVDEAHHAPARTYRSILRKINPQFMLGLTATPFRLDQESVFEIFGEPVINLGVYRALKQGFLAKVEYLLINDNVDVEWITKNSRRGHTIKQLNKKVFLPERDETICQRIFEEWSKGRSTRGIIFCNNTEHAQRIESILRSNFELPVWSLTTKIKSSRERSKRLRDFRVGNCKLITCYDMLNEGVDVPDVDFIVFLRVTHSRIYFLQQLGRGLRYKEGKTLLVHDYVADVRRLKRVKSFNDDFVVTTRRATEEIFFEDAFKLEFTSSETTNFLDLVSRDIREEHDENDEVYFEI